MNRYFERPSQRVRVQSKKDWKDHPVVVAALAVAGTSTLFASVIMPLSNSLLSAKLERLTETSATAVATAEELEKTKKALLAAQAALHQAVAKSPMTAGSAYPIGIDSVVIGTPKDQVAKRLPKGRWNEEKTYYSADYSGHPIFSAATYYFTDEKVDTILLHLVNNEVSAEIIRTFLRANYGEPMKTKKLNSLWQVSPREFVALEGITSRTSDYYIYKNDAVIMQVSWRDRQP